jgi:DNA-binding CsgD family transcriptional regulator
MRAANGSITAWNRGAEKLFSAPKGTVIGRRCHEVIAGRDTFGNDYCCAECASWRMSSSDRSVRPYRLSVIVGGGREVDLRITVLAVEGSRGLELIHILEPLACRGVRNVAGDDFECGDEWGGGRPALTRRELQVLRRLAAGNSTDDIASELHISPTTVRNQVSHCFDKLGVHSRVEAIHGCHMGATFRIVAL